MAKGRKKGGGGWDEAGGEYRRGVAALFVAYGLNGLAFPGLPIGGPAAVVRTVALETDDPIDDVVVGFPEHTLFIQAKRSLNFGRSFSEVAAQWLQAVRDDDFVASRDYIVAAAAALSGPVAALARALPRRQAGQSDFSLADEGAFARLRAIFGKLSATEAEINQILERAIILTLTVEESGYADAARGTLLLDGHVVAKGSGHDAWDALVSVAGHAARWRIGHSIKGWLDELRKRDLPLTADAEASRAAHLQMQHEALERYRQGLITRGRFIDLTPLGAAVPGIALADMDAHVSVADPSQDEPSSLDLMWAFRRRGRVLLTGLPGGGKSVAVAQSAGHWAEHDGWAIPIAVSLRSLAERASFRTRPLRERLLDLAVTYVRASDRKLVRDGLDQALASGDAVLFLDGLDEAADRSLPLTRQIADLLETVHPDTDVLLATRDVSYSHAHELLHFADLRLKPPEHSTRAVKAVLDAVADARRISNVEAWTKERLEWVERVLHADSQLRETPLLPVLLALLAADSDGDALPETRATILGRVIGDVVRRYEVRRELTFGALPEGQEADALLGAYPVIAAALSRHHGALPRTALIEELASYLAGQWNLAPGPARATAGEILVFWDESGIFVARGQQQLTSPRSQLFLEVGAALAAAAEPDEAEAFVHENAIRPERHETLILAAGLSAQIANAFADRGADDEGDTLPLAAAQAIREGAEVAEPPLRRLIDRLVAAVDSGDDVSWRAMKALVDLDVPPDAQELVLAAAAVYPPEHQTVATALAALRWDWKGDERAEALEAALRVEELPKLARRVPLPKGRPSLIDVQVDQGFMRAKERSTVELLPTRSELAPVVVAAMRHASSATADRLYATLCDNGHGELALAAYKEMHASISDGRLLRSFEGVSQEVEDALQAIVDLATPCKLVASQSRRLGELGSFLDTVAFNHAGRWPRDTWLAEVRPDWFRLIAALGEFDASVLAAQARLVQNELTASDHAAFFSLFNIRPPAEPTCWTRVDDPAAGMNLAVRMLALHQATPFVAAVALAAHPERGASATVIASVLGSIPHDSKRPAVWAYLQLVRDQPSAAAALAGSDDEGLRAALAAVWSLTEDGRPTALAEVLALDDDRRVQLAALEQFKNVDTPATELIALIQQVAAEGPRPFTCYRCGTVNDSDCDSCASCRIVTAKPNEEARDLLEEYADHPNLHPDRGLSD